jgi:hypothetical protein
MTRLWRALVHLMMCSIWFLGAHPFMPLDDRKAEARRSGSCAPQNSAKLKSFAPRLRPSGRIMAQNISTNLEKRDSTAPLKTK